jgi:hypothetical protein
MSHYYEFYGIEDHSILNRVYEGSKVLIDSALRLSDYTGYI